MISSGTGALAQLWINRKAQSSSLQSFFLGGFECSTQRRRDGRRLDLIASTGHDGAAETDYRQLLRHGMATVRDGLRWHLIEPIPHVYDWSSFLPMLRAANAVGTEVIWDLCHFGWPDHVDIWSPSFSTRFARFAGEAARIIREEGGRIPLYCPINEISFLTWIGGEVGHFNPFAFSRGKEMKRQCVRAAIAAIQAIREADPRARIMMAEPLIHVAAATEDPDDIQQAARTRLGQFEAYDMLLGLDEPELGGMTGNIDLIGANYYPHNQWFYQGATIPFGHHAYRPMSEILIELRQRYHLPILIAETGTEGSSRPSWLHYVCAEVTKAMQAGVRIEGICLYPILDYPSWDDDRHCQAGLLGDLLEDGTRPVCQATANELCDQIERMDRALRLQRQAGTKHNIRGYERCEPLLRVPHDF